MLANTTKYTCLFSTERKFCKIWVKKLVTWPQ